MAVRWGKPEVRRGEPRVLGPISDGAVIIEYECDYGPFVARSEPYPDHLDGLRPFARVPCTVASYIEFDVEHYLDLGTTDVRIENYDGPLIVKTAFTNGLINLPDYFVDRMWVDADEQWWEWERMLWWDRAIMEMTERRVIRTSDCFDNNYGIHGTFEVGQVYNVRATHHNIADPSDLRRHFVTR